MKKLLCPVIVAASVLLLSVSVFAAQVDATSELNAPTEKNIYAGTEDGISEAQDKLQSSYEEIVGGYSECICPEDRDYYFDSYKISITVGENNVHHVTETADVLYNAEKAGFVREIAYGGYLDRADGSAAYTSAKVENIKVTRDGKSERYTANIASQATSIQTGQPGKLLSGKHSYVIEYDYCVKGDLIEDADEFYFNLVDLNRDTLMFCAEFEITMPKEYSFSDVSITRGKTGDTAGERIFWDKDNGKITGKANDLVPGEGLVVRLHLPEGYFVESLFAKKETFIVLFANIAVDAAFIVFVGRRHFSWIPRKKSKGKNVVYHCDDISAFEAAVICCDDKKNAIGLSLLHLISERALFTRFIGIDKNDAEYSFTKTGESGNALSDLVMQKAFPCETINETTTSGLCSLKEDGFVSAFMKKLKSAVEPYGRERFLPFSGISFVLSLILSFFTVAQGEMFVSTEAVVIALMTSVFIALFTALAVSSPDRNKLLTVIISWAVYLVCFLVKGDAPHLDIFIILRAVLFGVTVIAASRAGKDVLSAGFKLTEKGVQKKKELRSFKKFLVSMDKAQFDALVAEDAEYFVKIAPYMYAFGFPQSRLDEITQFAEENPLCNTPADRFFKDTRSVHNILENFSVKK